MPHRSIFLAESPVRPPSLSLIRPAGQVAAPDPSTSVPSAPEIAVGADGRLSGVDGLLDQVAGAVVRQVRTELLPAIQQDKEMQRTVGEAAGRGAADELKPYIVLLSASIVLTGVLVWKSRRPRGNQGP